MHRLIPLALIAVLAGCSTFGGTKTHADRETLISNAEAAVVSASALEQVAEAKGWIDTATAVTVKKAVAAAQITIANAKEAEASEACTKEDSDSACGVTYALEAFDAAKEIIAMVQPPAAAATAASVDGEQPL